jgi:phosphopantothenoylcysteine decarboxylase/phosphopantothenate--cysteine ligase
MAAAVADYTSIRPSRTKIKKNGRIITLKLKPAPDILKWAGLHKHKNQFVVGFALDDRNLKVNAGRKLREKKADMIIANTPAAIGSEQCAVLVKKAGSAWLRFAKATKRSIARRLIRLLEYSV